MKNVNSRYIYFKNLLFNLFPVMLTSVDMNAKQ